MKTKLFLILLFNSCLVSSQTDSHYMEIDSVDVNQLLLEQIDKVIFNNKFYRYLSLGEKAEYPARTFVFQRRIIDNEGTFSLSCFDEAPEGVFDKYNGYFVYRNMLFFVRDLEKDTFSPMNKKKKFRLMHDARPLFDDAKPIIIEDDESPCLDIVFTHNDSIPEKYSFYDNSYGYCTVCQPMPEFPEGIEAAKKYFYEKLNLLQIQIHGKILIQFIVGSDGHLSFEKVVKSPIDIDDSVFIDIINDMPNWIPAKYKGKNCPCLLTFPIIM